MRVVVYQSAEDMAEAAAELVRDRLEAKPDLVMAVPAGRTPRRMYTRLRQMHEQAPIEFGKMRVFCIDELCPPAPGEGYFWRQIQHEFLTWARVPLAHRHRFLVDAPDLVTMCGEYEATIVRLGGLDLVMCGLGPNAHLASNEPGSEFDSRSRPVPLLADTVRYILTDAVQQGEVSDRAVTLGLATIFGAREVVVLVSGPGKRRALARVVDGPVTPEAPASILRSHPRCTILADREACP